MLAPELSRDEAFRERFRREGKNVAALDHTHIVTVHDSGEVDGRFYLAMRLVKGATLADRMRDGGLNAEETLQILVPIADALDTAHEIGLVHRDVKPQNILLSGRGEVYLADFGVARSSQTQGLTATGGFVGSFNYAAPEQALGKPTSEATDVYALTAVLFQCLTGQVPFPRDTDAGVLLAHISVPPPALDGPEAGEFNAVVAKGMAKDPAARYASAGKLMRAASEMIDHLSAAQRLAVPAFAGEIIAETVEPTSISPPNAPPDPTAVAPIATPPDPTAVSPVATPLDLTAIAPPVEPAIELPPEVPAEPDGTKIAAVDGTQIAAVEGTQVAAVEQYSGRGGGHRPRCARRCDRICDRRRPAVCSAGP